MHFAALSVAALAAVANAATIQIAVGLNGELSYTPPNATASVNDTLQFIFYPSNHSVIQSTFTSPCTPKAGGFYSGFWPTGGSGTSANQTIFEVAVNDTNPIWFYCGQTVGLTHCTAGMVGAINANTTGNATFSAYSAAASAATNVSDPAGSPVGGTFAALNSTNSSTGGAGNSTNTTAPASSGASLNAVAAMGSLGTAAFGAVAAAIVFAL